MTLICAVSVFQQFILVILLTLFCARLGQVGAQEDLALGHVAVQSSTWSDGSFPLNAGLAVDGNSRSSLNAHTCSHTDSVPGVNSWWAVDLGQDVRVKYISITNRWDCCAQRLANFFVGLTHNPPSNGVTVLGSYPICASYVGYPPAGATVNISCQTTTPPGRYLVIQLPISDFLTLCEVKVYDSTDGSNPLPIVATTSSSSSTSTTTTTTTMATTTTTSTSTPSPPVGLPGGSSSNKALYQPAYQSSTISDGSFPLTAGLTVDGNNNPLLNAHSCSHTDDVSGINSWWAVDLGQVFRVQYVRVTNRGDCCFDRLSNFIIGTSNTYPSNTATLVGSYSICATYSGYPPGGATVNITCQSSTQLGQYVIIQLPQPGFLTLCEVEVYVWTQTGIREINTLTSTASSSTSTLRKTPTTSSTTTTSTTTTTTPATTSTTTPITSSTTRTSTPSTTSLTTALSTSTKGVCNSTTQFQCQTTGVCIPIGYRCNGQVNCKDGSDEWNCPVCSPSQGRFPCTNGLKCIPFPWVCDGFNDCGDNSDETTYVCSCNVTTQFLCSTGQCIPVAAVCNGVNDCPYSSLTGGYDDELYCSKPCSPSSSFKCSTGPRCVPLSWKCDGYNDCGDRSDELGCTSCSLSTQTPCANGIGPCISLSEWCDGMTDCRDKSDELPGCQNTCPTNTIRCVVTQQCLNYNQFCDGFDDCPDGSDEQNCGCYTWQFTCNNGGCISSTWLCDGTNDCSTGEDETLAICKQCTSSQFKCLGSRSCISLSQQCDGISQCNDTSDEAQCLSNLNSGGGGSQSNPLLVKFSGVPNYYVCADSWSSVWSDMVCQEIGYGPSSLTSYIAAPSASLILKLKTAQTQNSVSLLEYLQTTNSCFSNQVVSINCSALGCGTRAVSAASIGPYIVNGQLAARGAWPWQVLIVFSYGIGGRVTCGGSLINDRWVVTAAHCAISFSDPRLLSVRAGSIYLDKDDPDAQLLAVDRVISNPSYLKSQARNVVINDVALLRLATPVRFTDTIRPICLPTVDVNLNQFKVCVATGYGYTRPDTDAVSKFLLQAKLPLMSVSTCQQTWLQITRSPWKAAPSDFNYMICAGNYPATDNSPSVCSGDSGGPLACEDQDGVWKLIGVTSFGLPCAMSVFSRVSAYVNWFSSTMAANS